LSKHHVKGKKVIQSLAENSLILSWQLV